ncbi:uncharacterized protein EV420DRAFT_1642178 [Desarmillaria tabescens]|uniref:Uncharacterized protein n=1 Tax=Armillaria tabescens TaxID=1929756 RepID=A0AA39KDW6_ARMTA|nr:uncharacterized protein EV420DRAFT_1642178 [Desarmillaria tabescens]KAK0459192.1 hypothetical protein EV420DRAFT_1642178 [Desarmillaria tabescens]
MSNQKNIGTHAAPIRKYYQQQLKHANEYAMTKRHDPVMSFGPSFHHCGLAYQQALEWAQSLTEIWKRPASNDTVRYFPFIDTLRIRLWDSNIPRRPDSSMRVFGLDFVDARGDPQRVGPDIVVVAGKRASYGPEMEGDVLIPIDGVGGPENTVPERYGVVANCEYFFLAGGETVVAYTFDQDLLS